VVLRLKNLGSRKQTVKTVKEPKKQILCHESELYLLKDKAMHGGDNPSY
jgi:hypothetical protein